MRKHKIFTIIILFIFAIPLLFLIVNRQNNKNSVTDTCITDTIGTIYWNCADIDDEEFRISSITNNYSLLRLENSDPSFIGEINKIEFYDSLIFVLDKKYLSKILVFNGTIGSYICTIGKIGQGPGEYLSLNDFSIDKENNKIYLLCNKNLVYTYTLLGEFIESKELPFYASNMEVLGEKLYFKCDTRSSHHLIITDKNINIISKKFRTDLYRNIDREQVHHFQKRNNELIFHRFLDNNIYKIDSDGKISIAYQLLLGEDAITFKDVTDLSSKELKKELKQKTYYKYFTETEEYAFLVFIKNGIPHLSIYNKSNNQIQTHKYENALNDYLNDKLPILEYEHPLTGFIGILNYEALTNNDNIDETNPILILFD